MNGAALAELLRDPSEIARRCREDDGVREIAVVSLIAITVGSLAFGGVLGSFRAETQILWSGIKLPLAMLGTLALCVPALHGVACALGRPRPMRATATLVLAATARAALVLLAASPVLWLAIDSGLGYHASALLAAIVYGLSGLAALGIVLRGLGAGPGWLTTAVAFVAIFLAVGGQVAWNFRPFLGRPSQSSIPFVRAPEGSFADALVTSAQSAAGIYRHSDLSDSDVDDDAWDTERSRATDPYGRRAP